MCLFSIYIWVICSLLKETFLDHQPLRNNLSLSITLFHFTFLNSAKVHLIIFLIGLLSAASNQNINSTRAGALSVFSPLYLQCLEYSLTYSKVGYWTTMNKIPHLLQCTHFLCQHFQKSEKVKRALASGQHLWLVTSFIKNNSIGLNLVKNPEREN